MNKNQFNQIKQGFKEAKEFLNGKHVKGITVDKIKINRKHTK